MALDDLFMDDGRSIDKPEHHDNGKLVDRKLEEHCQLLLGFLDSWIDSYDSEQHIPMIEYSDILEDIPGLSNDFYPSPMLIHNISKRIAESREALNGSRWAGYFLSVLIQESYRIGYDTFDIVTNDNGYSIGDCVRGTLGRPIKLHIDGSIDKWLGYMAWFVHFEVEGDAGSFVGWFSSNCTYDLHGKIERGEHNRQGYCNTYYARDKETYSYLCDNLNGKKVRLGTNPDMPADLVLTQDGRDDLDYMIEP